MSVKQQKHWDKRAENYLGIVRGPYVTQENIDRLYAHMDFLKLHFPPQTSSVKRNVLEVGAGIGQLAPILFANDAGMFDPDNRHVMLLDFSSKMNAFSRQRILKKVATVSHLQADSRKVPLKDATCDEVYIVNGFHNPSVNDQISLFSEIGRVLRPGGMLYGLFHSWEDVQMRTYREAASLRAKRNIPYEVALAAEEDTNRTLWKHTLVKGSVRGENVHFDMKMYSRRELDVLVSRADLDLCHLDVHRIGAAWYDKKKDDTFEWIVAARK